MQLPKPLAELGKQRMGNASVEGFVYGQGPENPTMMLVGEAPGETEIHNGIPFSGRAGKELKKSLDRIELTREEIYITSAVRSRPYIWKEKIGKDGVRTKRKYNRPPTAKEILAHAPLLDYEIEHINTPVIVTLGNVGLNRLCGNLYKVSDCHGQFIKGPVRKLEGEKYQWSEEEYVIFPTFHPASVFYNRKLETDIWNDFILLKSYLQDRLSNKIK